MSDEKKRFNYLRQPHIGRVSIALAPLLEALNEHSAYFVGSVLERPNFNDIDIVIIMDDAKYDSLFGKSGNTDIAAFSKWFNASSSELLRFMTGLPIDFRVQKMSVANKNYPSQPRDPIGLNVSGPDYDPAWLHVRTKYGED